MSLSILIPTVNGREYYFDRLIERLDDQIKNRDVEVIPLKDLKGQMSIGEKRNRLIAAAGKKYVQFIDDDDMVSENMMDLIWGGIKDGVDVIELRGIIKDGFSEKTFVHSIQYDHYFERNGVYYRPPNHLNPMLKEKAELVKFQHISFGEDTDWAMRMQRTNMLKTQHIVLEPYYFYTFVQNKHY
jgi:glycosyltransferase involved in cell wall biosynthesis